MCKTLALALLLLSGITRAAVPSISLPLDWTGAAGISRANLNLNPIALRDGANAAIDSLNPILSVLTGYSNSLALASNQDLLLKVDVDANGTNKLVVTGNNLDSLLRINEDGTARLFGAVTLDSSLTVGKRLYLADSLKLTLLTASSPVLALDATKHVIAGTTTGSGSTVVLSSGPTIVNPTWSGTIATGLTASRTLTTDASGNMAVNTETGTGSHVRATSPTTSNLTNTGTLTAAAINASGAVSTGALTATTGAFSSTLNAIGDLTVGNGTTGSTITVKPPAGTTGGYQIYSGSSIRWFLYKGSAGESGSDAGSPFRLSAYTDGGVFIDNPIDIVRAAGGAITLGRPVSMSSTAAVTGKITGSDTVVGTLGGRFGSLKLTGRFIDQTTTVTSGSTTLGATHSTIFANATSGNITLNLPAASGLAGLTYTIFKTDATTNTVTVDGNSTETVGGDATIVLGSNTGSAQLVIVCDGSNWQIKTLYDEGSWTAAATGMSACTVGSLSGSTCTGTGYFIRNRKQVHVFVPNLLGTSNSTALTVTGLPSHLSAARTQEVGLPAVAENTNSYTGFASLTGTTITLSFKASTLTYPSPNFSSSGLKGFDMYTFMYTLQ